MTTGHHSGSHDRSSDRSLADENRRLKRAVHELTFLRELAAQIGASLDSQLVMKTINRRSLLAVGAEQSVITMVARDDDRPQNKTLVRATSSSRKHEPLHLDESILGWMYQDKKPLVVNDPSHDTRFRKLNVHDSVRSFVCVPLLVKSELTGVLCVYNKRGQGGFTEDDERLLSIIANQSAQVVENARLHEEEKAAGHMREELRLAKDIQLALLPKASPEIPAYDVAGVSIPAKEVGGDYFDFIPMTENRWAICLGDVSGKGLPAAVLMSNVQATIRGQALAEASPRECVARANLLFLRSTDVEKFVTLFYGVLDTNSHSFCYCNAGHNPPLFFSGGGSERELATEGIVLGVSEEFPYEEATVSIRPGDSIVIFSDGVTEAEDSTENQFGDERLLRVVHQGADQSAERLVQSILAAVRKHAGDQQQSDDITVVVIKRVSP